jgi:hypothetical protein
MDMTAGRNTNSASPDLNAQVTSLKLTGKDIEKEEGCIAGDPAMCASADTNKRQPSMIELRDYDLIHLPRAIRKFWQVKHIDKAFLNMLQWITHDLLFLY